MDEKFSGLLGKTISSIDRHEDDELIFTLSTGEKYRMYHDQDCCESVLIEDIAGDLDDLIGSEILMAEEATNSEDPGDNINGYIPDSFTWTFYKLATIKGYVTIRWYGEGNGYYSESVDWDRI